MRSDILEGGCVMRFEDVMSRMNLSILMDFIGRYGRLTRGGGGGGEMETEVNRGK